MVKFNKKKTKKFFKRVGKGASTIGTSVAKGAGSLAKKGYESYKDYTSPEAQEMRLAAQEKKLVVQERIAQRKARIAKLQPKGRGMLGGFQGIDMGNILGGEQPPKKRKGKPFNPFNQF